jgi:hypothetical protein
VLSRKRIRRRSEQSEKRVGYITDFNGLSTTFQKDLQIRLPFRPTYAQLGATQGVKGSPLTAKVVGVIETFVWPGGAGDPIAIRFYVSQQNAALLKALTTAALRSTSIQSIGWWIGDYGQTSKGWFEEAQPASAPTLKAIIQGSPAQPMLNVVLTPVKAASAIDVNVYAVSVEILPPPHLISKLSFATAPGKLVTKTWGLQ